jgi:hypothetical protein
LVLLDGLNVTAKFSMELIASRFLGLGHAERQARKRTTRCEPASQIAGEPGYA